MYRLCVQTLDDESFNTLFTDEDKAMMVARETIRESAGYHWKRGKLHFYIPYHQIKWIIVEAV